MRSGAGDVVDGYNGKGGVGRERCVLGLSKTSVRCDGEVGRCISIEVGELFGLISLYCNWWNKVGFVDFY